MNKFKPKFILNTGRRCTGKETKRRKKMLHADLKMSS